MGEISIRADTIEEIVIIGVVVIIACLIMSRRRVEVWIKDRAVRRNGDHPGENSEEE